MPDPASDTTATEAQLRADLRAAALVEERAALEKLTKAELIERLQAARTEGEEMREALRSSPPVERRARPEDAFVVSALLDLHRAALHAGRHDAQRYLDAALKMGTPLADAILAAE
jgi:hypothetical protein